MLPTEQPLATVAASWRSPLGPFLYVQDRDQERTVDDDNDNATDREYLDRLEVELESMSLPDGTPREVERHADGLPSVQDLEVLHRVGEADRQIRSALTTLINAGHASLVPWMLRRHLRAQRTGELMLPLVGQALLVADEAKPPGGLTEDAQRKWSESRRATLRRRLYESRGINRERLLERDCAVLYRKRLLIARREREKQIAARRASPPEDLTVTLDRIRRESDAHARLERLKHFSPRDREEETTREKAFRTLRLAMLRLVEADARLAELNADLVELNRDQADPALAVVTDKIDRFRSEIQRGQEASLMTMDASLVKMDS